MCRAHGGSCRPAHLRRDARQLDRGGHRRADGDRPAEGRAGQDADGARNLQKSDGVFRRGVPAGNAFVGRHRTVWPVMDQRRVLKVSVSGFRAWRKRGRGWPRLWRQMRAQGLGAGHERVRRTMKNNGMRVHPRRRFKATTDCDPNLPIARNLPSRGVFRGRAGQNPGRRHCPCPEGGGPDLSCHRDRLVQPAGGRLCQGRADWGAACRGWLAGIAAEAA